MARGWSAGYDGTRVCVGRLGWHAAAVAVGTSSGRHKRSLETTMGNSWRLPRQKQWGAVRVGCDSE